MPAEALTLHAGTGRAGVRYDVYPPHYKRKHKATLKCLALTAIVLATPVAALADDAATVGREGQAFGKSLADKMNNHHPNSL